MFFFVALGGVSLAYEMRESQIQQIEKSEKEAPERLLPKMLESEVEKISVVSEKGTYALVHPEGENAPDGSWVLAKPKGALIDSTRLNLILSALKQLTSRNTIEESEIDPDADFGLEPAKMTVIFTGAHVPAAISFGNKHPLSSRRYAQLEGDARIFLVDEQVYDSLNASAQDIRERRPMRVDIESIGQVLAIRPGGDIVRFERSGDKKLWTAFTHGGSIAIDPLLFVDRLQRFLSVKVGEFIDDPVDIEGFYGLTSPVLTLAIRRDANDVEPLTTIEVGEGVSPAGIEVFFRDRAHPFIYRSGYPFHLDFLKSPEFFRDRQPFRGQSPADVATLSVRWKDGKIKVFDPAKSSEWTEPNITALRSEVLSLDILNFEPPDPATIGVAGLLAPEAEISFTFKSNPKSFRLLFGKPIERQDGHEDAAARPRWIGIQGSDAVLRPAVLGSAGTTTIQKLLDALRSVP